MHTNIQRGNFSGHKKIWEKGNTAEDYQVSKVQAFDYYSNDTTGEAGVVLL